MPRRHDIETMYPSSDRFAVFKMANATGADAAVTLFITWQELPE